MDSAQTVRTVVQCDFDGTVTEQDVSFVMLDAFARGNWRRVLKQYRQGRITVGEFNSRSFAMVKADRDSLLRVAMAGMRVRHGFLDFVACCRRKGFRLAVVSNGLDFYVTAVLDSIGAGDVEVSAAQTSFTPTDGIRVSYVAPDGRPLDDGFKLAYVEDFLRQGYRVVYAGNGGSDFSPASRCHRVFATGQLLAHCRRRGLGCIPFETFDDVVSVLETL